MLFGEGMKRKIKSITEKEVVANKSLRFKIGRIFSRKTFLCFIHVLIMHVIFPFFKVYGGHMLRIPECVCNNISNKRHCWSYQHYCIRKEKYVYERLLHLAKSTR